MLQIVNVIALTVLRSLDASLLCGADVAIRRRVRFSTVDMHLAALGRLCFLVGERTALHTVRDSLLLIHVALHVRLHALG